MQSSTNPTISPITAHASPSTVRGPRLLAVFLLSVLLLPAQHFSRGDWETDTSKKSIDLDELKLGGPPKDGIPALREPKFVSVKEAASWVDPKEPVIVVEIGGEARAYPLQVLIWHEMAADKVGGVPILVTYCPLCNSSIAFDRRVDGKVYDFGVSGMLRHSDMVMFDRQTDSLWQQITGEAIVGEMTGQRLEVVTSQVVDFGAFAENFPGGKVLSKNTGYNRPYGTTPYAGYEQSGRPMFPVPQRRRLRDPLDRVVSFTLHGKTKAYTFDWLRRKKVARGKIKGTRFVIFYDPTAVSPMEKKKIAASRQVGSAGVFSPELDGEVLKFRYKDGKIIDKQTGSTWNVFGMAVNGPLEGKRLEPVTHGIHYAFAWMSFMPDTDLVGGGSPQPTSGFGRQSDAPGGIPGAGTPGDGRNPFPR